MELLNVGLGNFIAIEKILAIAWAGSAPIKRLIVEAKTQNKLIDMTHGKKTKSVIIMDNGYIIQCTLKPETVDGRTRRSIINKEEE